MSRLALCGLAAGALLTLAPAVTAQTAAPIQAMSASAPMAGLGFATETPGLDPYEVAMIQTVSDPIVSPDGRYVAYRLAIPADPLKENAPASAELRLLDLQTGATTMPLGSQSVSGLQFLPDGHLAFRTKMEGDAATSVYTMRPGQTPERLMTFETSIQSFALTPGGQQVVFVASEPVAEDESGVPDVVEIYEEEFGASRVYVAAVGGSMAPVPLRIPGHVHSMALSPMGDKLPSPPRPQRLSMTRTCARASTSPTSPAPCSRKSSARASRAASPGAPTARCSRWLPPKTSTIRRMAASWWCRPRAASR